MALAYSHGTSTVSLLGQTIGENLREQVRRFPDRDVTGKVQKYVMRAKAVGLLGLQHADDVETA